MEVSVIIPNFNGIAFLESVLGSLEGQTLKNFEVILVDNGSADGSCSFVSANYPWVHIIELPDNFGFCRAVNEGIKAAKARPQGVMTIIVSPCMQDDNYSLLLIL